MSSLHMIRGDINYYTNIKSLITLQQHIILQVL